MKSSQNTNDELVLHLEDLVKHFQTGSGVVAAVNGISLRIRRGESVALVGETGSGKTTVGRCILRLETATSGRIDVMGQDVTRLKKGDLRTLRARVQMVFQDPYDALDPYWKIGRTIEEPLRWLIGKDRRARQRRITEVLELVGLDKAVAASYPSSLTPAERQQVVIARALAPNPQLLVLDEATSRLDVRARGRIITLLQELRSRLGVAYLFISHDLTAVERISERIAVMYLGKIVETGSTEAVTSYPLHPYTTALMSSALLPDPDHDPGRFLLKGEIPSPLNLPGGCHLASRCPLVQERCLSEEPLLREVRPGHWVSCHRAEEIGRGDVSPSLAVAGTTTMTDETRVV